jgi:hypothetical protein
MQAVFIVVCIIIHASIPGCGCGEDGVLEESSQHVNISGMYQLEEVENYEEYLLATEIPPAAVRHIKMMKWVK